MAAHKRYKGNWSLEPRGIIAQTDEWFGRRHRIYYFLTGFVVALAAAWYLYSQLINPKLESIHREAVANVHLQSADRIADRDKELAERNFEIQELRKSISESEASMQAKIMSLALSNDSLGRMLIDSSNHLGALRDTIEQIKAFGLYLGIHRLPFWHSENNQEEVMRPILGDKLSAVAMDPYSDSNITVIFYIDTCPPIPAKIDSGHWECRSIEDWQWMRIGVLFQTGYGEDVFTGRCVQVGKDFLEIEVWWRNSRKQLK